MEPEWNKTVRASVVCRLSLRQHHLLVQHEYLAYHPVIGMHQQTVLLERYSYDYCQLLM